MTKKVFTKKTGNVLVNIAFTRPSETGRARKTTEYQGKLERAKRILRNLEVRKQEYNANIDFKIKDIQVDIAEANAYLEVLGSEDFQEWIDKQAEEIMSSFARAEDLLRTYLGSEAYEVLVVNGFLEFESQGRIFKVTKEGFLYEKKGEEWEPRCLIRPKELPTPDFVISLLTTLKENPDLWQRR